MPCAFCHVVNDLGGSPTRSATFEVVPSSSQKPGLLVAVVLSAGVLILGVGVVALQGGPGLGGVFREWYTTPCPVDANGDGVLDIAGRGAFPGSDHWAPLVVDGKTGRALWNGKPTVAGARDVCWGPGLFAVDEEDFKLRLFAAKAPDAERIVQLEDHVSSYGAGQNCLRLQLANGSTVSLAVNGERIARCEASESINPGRRLGVSTSSSEAMAVTVGSRSFELTTRQPGTPFLTLSASENGKPIWRRDFPFIQADLGKGLAIAGDLIMVYGAEPRGDEFGVLIGVDAATGVQRYAVPQGSHWSGRIQGMFFNGQYVIVMWGFGLHAYDPADGKRVWNIGGR